MPSPSLRGQRGKPSGLFTAETFKHGTRSRYVGGCRCSACKRANLAYYHERQAALKDAAPGVRPSGPPLEGVLVRGGVRYAVKRCPGANGAPCVRAPAAWLRGGDVCGVCVQRATVWNGNVDAGPVRAHLQWLSEQGVGYKTAAGAAGVGTTLVARILAGTKTKLRAQSASVLLAVTPAAIAGHANVPAHPTWDRLRRLLAEGLTKAQIVRILGSRLPALQFRRTSVLVATALEVTRLFDTIMDRSGPPPEELPKVLDILRASPRPLTVREVAGALTDKPAAIVEAPQQVLRSLVRLRADHLALRSRDARGRVRWRAAPAVGRPESATR